MADLIDEVINQRDPYQSQTVATARGRARPPMMAPPVNLPRVKAFEQQRAYADRTVGPETTARDEAAGAMALPRTIRPGYTPTQQLVSDATEFTGLPQLARGIGHIQEAASTPTIDPRGTAAIGDAIGEIAPLGLAFLPMGEELGAGLPRMRAARPPVSETMFANSNTHMPPPERMQWLRGIVEDAQQQQTAAEGVNDLANGEYHFRRGAHANAEMDHMRTQIGLPTRARQIVMAERRGTIENLVHGQEEPMAPAAHIPGQFPDGFLPFQGVPTGARPRTPFRSTAATSADLADAARTGAGRNSVGRTPQAPDGGQAVGGQYVRNPDTLSSPQTPPDKLSQLMSRTRDLEDHTPLHIRQRIDAARTEREMAARIAGIENWTPQKIAEFHRLIERMDPIAAQRMRDVLLRRSADLQTQRAMRPPLPRKP